MNTRTENVNDSTPGSRPSRPVPSEERPQPEPPPVKGPVSSATSNDRQEQRKARLRRNHAPSRVGRMLARDDPAGQALAARSYALALRTLISGGQPETETRQLLWRVARACRERPLADEPARVYSWACAALRQGQREEAVLDDIGGSGGAWLRSLLSRERRKA